MLEALVAACVFQTPRSDAQSASPPASSSTLKNFGYADLLRLRSVQDVHISPDSQRVAFVVSAADAQNDGTIESVWLLRVADRLPVELAPAPSGSPVWSPDSHQLAFVAPGLGGSPAVTLLYVDHPRSRRVFPLPSQPDSLTWSPDGRWLAMTLFVPDTGAASFLQQAIDQADASLDKPYGAKWAPHVKLTQQARYHADGTDELKPGHQHLFLVSTETAVLRQITSGPFDDRDPSWLPDGTGLFFASDRRMKLPNPVRVPAIQKVSLSSGIVVQISRGTDHVQNPVASPDGEWIAYTSTEERHVNYSISNLYVMRADGREPRRLATRLDRDVYGPRWAGDGRGIYASYEDHGLSRVGLFGLDETMTEVAAGTDLNFSVSRAGDVAYAGASIDRPTEAVLKRIGAGPITLTAENDFLRERSFGGLLHLEVPSSLDRVPVEAWVLLPPAARPDAQLPAILTMHGGPFGYDDPGWVSAYQLYAAAGYAVVFANYRGSTSYGSAFAEPANHNFPGCAYDDLMSVMDAVVQQRIADPDRLFLTGGSAGGELTAWIIGKTNRFRAAAAEKPVINQISESLSSDQYLAAKTLSAPPWDREGDLWARSPLSLMASVATPTLLITGENDYGTPLTETLQFYDALQLRGIPASLQP